MQLELTVEQFEIIRNLVDSRISEIHPEIRRSRVYSVHDELKHDLEVLQDLQQSLRQVQTQPAKTDGTWEDYVEARKIPSNPPPGS